MSLHLDTREIVDHPFQLWNYSSQICAKKSRKKKQACHRMFPPSVDKAKGRQLD